MVVYHSEVDLNYKIVIVSDLAYTRYSVYDMWSLGGWCLADSKSIELRDQPRLRLSCIRTRYREYSQRLGQGLSTGSPTYETWWSIPRRNAWFFFWSYIIKNTFRDFWVFSNRVVNCSSKANLKRPMLGRDLIIDLV